jgi:serine phosphatase RsbU (regulator of sigma subunit)
MVAVVVYGVRYYAQRRQVLAYQQAAVEELRDAQQVQMSLMPEVAPKIEGIEIAGKCIPAREVSGDFFDYLAGKQADEICVVVADVTGKAMKGAMNAVMTDGILHSVATGQADLSPALLLRELNEVLKLRMEQYMNVTMVIGLLNAKTKKLTLANAAHHAYPRLLRNGEVQSLVAKGMPLGMKAGIAYREQHFRLESGDVLIFMTDGIIDAQDSDGQYYVLSGQLEQTIAQLTPESSATAMVNAVINGAIAFGGQKAERSDDMTVVVAKIR